METPPSTATTSESAALQGLEFESDGGEGVSDAGLSGAGLSGDMSGVGVIDVVAGAAVDRAAAASRMQSKTPDVAFGKAASMSR